MAKLDKIEENLVMNTRTGVKSEIKKRSGMYVYPLTIRRKKNDANALDIGAIGQFEHKNQFEEIEEEEDMCQACNDTMEGLYRQVFGRPIDARKTNLRL